MRLTVPQWITVFVGALCLILLLPMLLAPLTTSPGRSTTSVALSRLQHLNMALHIYLAENDDRFPLDTSSPRKAAAALTPYLRDQSLLAGFDKASPEYLGNGDLAGRPASAFPPTTIVFFASAPDSQGHRPACFVDGSGAKLTEDAFQQAVRDDWVWKHK